MALHTIVLTNGETIQVNTTLSIAGLKRIREKDAVSKDILQNIVSFNKKDINMLGVGEDAAEAVYIAYLNANKDQEVMSKEELFEVLPYDLITNTQIYGEVIGGPQLGKTFAEHFSNFTKKEINKKK